MADRLETFLCVTCGTSFPPAAIPPRSCPICSDERQFVPRTGQRWITRAQLAATHSNAWRLLEPNLFEIHTTPNFAIGQRALLVRTDEGNILWDCIALFDDATKALLDVLGGLTAIAISHPHYYSAMQDWAAAYDVPVYLHANDRDWVMRPDERLSFWEGDWLPLPGGLEAVRLGGHFPGGTILHWPGGAEGRGALLTGDIVQVGADRSSVSFLWSYPNNLPLSGLTVSRMASTLQTRSFENVYGAFGLHIIGDGTGVICRSALRYLTLLRSEQH